MTEAAPLVRDALSDRVYDNLRTRVINGELVPGSRLNMDAIAREMRVSQTPIREAVNRLASERLVRIEPYRGVQIAPLLTPGQLEDLMRARLVVEVGAVQSPKALLVPANELERLIREMDRLAAAAQLDIQAFNEADARFHRLLVSQGDNEFLLQAFDDLQVHTQIARHFQGRSVAEARRANREHRKINAALRRGDVAGLAGALEGHVTGVLRRLTGGRGGGRS
jgi:DNA-binding GntR family transcriptional regulator